MPRGKVKWFREGASPGLDSEPVGYTIVKVPAAKVRFLQGVQRALDLGGVFTFHSAGEEQVVVTVEADAESLGEDWRSVGTDLLAAMNEHTRHPS